MRATRWTAVAVGMALAAAGCTLAEVVVPESEDVLVVEAVLRTDRARQMVLLHRSVRDGASVAEPGASVVVRGPGGVEAALEEMEDPAACFTVYPAYLAGNDPVEVRGSCYASAEALGRWVVPGATYALEVSTTRGERARGRTTVPGAFALRGFPFSAAADAPAPVCALPAETAVPLRWTPAAGAWAYIAPLQVSGLSGVLAPGVEAPEPLELIGISVSARDTMILLPSQFGVFDRFRLDQELLRLLQRGLPAGVSARVIVAAADRNYVNGVRGGTFNPSGQVRISSILGDGVGVFGSLVPLESRMEVGPPAADRPPCGP
jgi:hypothetical protein